MAQRLPVRNIVVNRHGDIAGYLDELNKQFGTQFALMRFRYPERNKDGRWNCRFQLPTLDSRYGEVERDHGYPTRRMFDVRYIRAQVMHDRYWWKARIKLESADDGENLRIVSDHPLILTENTLWLDDALDAELLITQDEDIAMPFLYALVERKTRIVFPVAEDCWIRVEIRAGGESKTRETWQIYPDKDTKDSVMDVLIQSGCSHKEPKDDVYDHYFDTPSTVSDEEVLARLREDSGLLRQRLMQRDDEHYRIVREAVSALRADNPPDADDGREWCPEDIRGSKGETR